MHIVFKGIVPKELEYPDNNEDTFLREGNVVAVSDGASESFDAKNWARILVRKFVQFAHSGESWLPEAIKEYSRLHDREELSWAKQASFDRGSFATLLGITFHEESKSAEVLAIGDSLAVLVSNGSFDRSYPYTSSQDFEQDPVLLSTNHGLNDFYERQDFLLSHSVTWDLRSLTNPLLLCMTDALGRWFLETYPSDATILESLLSFRHEAELRTFVTALREKKVIRIDDTTLIVLDMNG
jgi:serine/threonine protein phosphatase PrpC